MSSFKRKAGSTSHKLPPGTKSSPSLSTLLLTSSGIPSLDDVLGGGVQLGTSLLVLNPDPHSSHTELLQKYFIAQGLACSQQVYIFDTHGRSLAESCMWVTGASMTPRLPDDEDIPDGNGDKVKIAWRYERMQKFRTTISSHSSDLEDYCRPFDLSSRIPPAAIEDFIHAGHLHIENKVFEESGNVFSLVLQRLMDIGKQYEDSLRSSKDVFRICIPAFCSPSWGDPRPEDAVHFLLRLRSLLRNYPLMCVLATMPSHISAEAWGGEGWADKLGWASDACISLNSFSADPATAALFPSHHGLLKIHKLPCVQTLVPASDRFSSLRGLSTSSTGVSSGGVGENNLAFKCTRKRLVIETFHLDVEGGVGERRTTPAASTPFGDMVGGIDSSLQHHPTLNHVSVAAVEVNLDATGPPDPETQPVNGGTTDAIVTDAMATEEKKMSQKKPKKRVGFQVERPDLYDF
ncbi:hypothetical protein M0805_004243 [Coniferiporia weirii]|nr:hypothetical protein M0805_004243 [Coniferiporia weirii]